VCDSGELAADQLVVGPAGGVGAIGAEDCPTLGLEMQPEVAAMYLQQLLSLGLETAPMEHGDALQVPLDSFVAIETEIEAVVGAPSDERVQVAHKLLFDALNAALRKEAASILRSKPARPSAAGSGSALPLRTYLTLPASEAALKRVAVSACQQAVAWRVQGIQAEGMPVEVLLGTTLPDDAATIERGWQGRPCAQEEVMAELADRVLDNLIGEMREWPAADGCALGGPVATGVTEP
jgi:hypothetical protein